jgi:predicted nuclease with TOPRIM domain
VRKSSAELGENEKSELDQQRRVRKRIKELEDEIEILKRFTAYRMKGTGK